MSRVKALVGRWAQAAKQGPLGGVLLLMAGTAGAQGLSLLAAPILTRLYSPESFGQFTYMLSAAAIIGSVASIGLELAVPLVDRTSAAQKLIRMAVAASTATALLTAAVVVIFPEALSQAANFDVRGIHLTGGVQISRSPGSLGWGSLQAGRLPTGAGRSRRSLLGLRVQD